MPKTKISEFSATPANNTDIDSINIAEGCAPSGINDAIRELMSQLKDFQTGAVGDSFNGPVGTTTAAAGAFTTLSASSTLAVTGVATLTAQPILSSLTASRAVFTDASKGLVSNAITGTGNVVMSTSPTLVTPTLGVATATSLQGIIGNVTPAAGAFTTVDASGAVTLSGGTANGVTYLNGSKVLTSGSALVFDGTNLGIGTSPTLAKLQVAGTAYIQDTLTISSVLVGANITDATGSNITLKAGNSNLSVNQGAGYITATVQAVERMRLNATGALVLSGGNTSASGVGITFPATQSASSDANTLDDYEEGTWTPTDASGAGLTLTSVAGNYTKIGRQVIAYFNVTFPSTVSGAQITIGGLPYASASAAAVSNPGGGGFTYQTASISNVTFAIGAGGTQFNMWTLAGAAVGNASASTFSLRGFFTYFTN